jgi:hypothetical protein
MAKQKVIGAVMVTGGGSERVMSGKSVRDVLTRAMEEDGRFRGNCELTNMKPRKCPSGSSVCVDARVMCEKQTIYFTGGRTNRTAKSYRNKHPHLAGVRKRRRK